MAQVGIAIGDMILNVSAAQAAGLYKGKADKAAQLCNRSTLNDLMTLDSNYLSALRAQTSNLLRADTPKGRKAENMVKDILLPMANVEMLKPVQIGDFSDFTASIYHATNAGQIFNPNTQLVPNYKYLPIAYHGRSSSIVVSNTPVKLPVGQTKAPNAVAPTVGVSKRFDYELEIGFYLGKANTMGSPIAIHDAESYLFGISLVNDWSARDIQAWEMQPLGPFLSKSTATTVSAWVITMEALAPFRRAAFVRSGGDPAIFPHMFSESDQQNGGFDISLTIQFSTAQMRAKKHAPVKLSQTSTKYLFWTASQLLTHHTSNGCNMNVGDMYASGTLSGPSNDERGCLLELTWGGRDPIELPTGEKRSFLEVGDEVIFNGHCEHEQFRRIGFGECRGIIV